MKKIKPIWLMAIGIIAFILVTSYNPQTQSTVGTCTSKESDTFIGIGLDLLGWMMELHPSTNIATTDQPDGSHMIKVGEPLIDFAYVAYAYPGNCPPYTADTQCTCQQTLSSTSTLTQHTYKGVTYYTEESGAANLCAATYDKFIIGTLHPEQYIDRFYTCEPVPSGPSGGFGCS